MNWQKKQSRQRTIDDAKEAASGSISTLELLASAYDDGKFSVARELAVVLSRLIDSELLAVGTRRELRIPSFAEPVSQSNLTPQFRHVLFRLNGQSPCKITFMPISQAVDGTVHPVVQNPAILKFPEWWGEAVIIEGAGGMSGLIPLKEADQIPFNKRRKLSRREAVTTLRNKLGAHYDSLDTAGLTFLMKWDHAIEFGVQGDDGTEITISKNPEHFQLLNSHGDAIIRAVTAEILSSNVRDFI